MQYNMSPETITDLHLQTTVDQLLDKQVDLQQAYDNNYAVAANGWCFTRDKRGLLPTQMQRYYDLRVVYKNQMLNAKQQYENTKDPQLKKEISRLHNLQMAMKILLNSAYGSIGNSSFRYFDIRIAEGITISGQLSIRWIANKLNELFNKTLGTTDIDRVVLIDTDSVVLTLDDLIKKVCADKTTEQKIKYLDKIADSVIQPFIDKSYQQLADYMNAYEQKMHMKRENLVDTMISVSKKRYVMSVHNSEGVQYAEPQLKIMGLQMVKSSTPAIIRDKLKQSLDIILRGTESDIQKYVNDFRVEFNRYTPEQVAFPRGISDVAKFENASTIYNKSTPIHVRGALLYNHYIKQYRLTNKYPMIREGDKIKFLYLKTPNPIRENCISFVDKLPEEFNLSQYVDYGKMFEKTFEDAIQDILDSIQWSTRPKPTLEDFFT
jgi:DNA polymerase elongation subunit (family B)